MKTKEPSRVRPHPKISARYSAQVRRDTRPELALRRELHKRGLRYRVQLRVPANRRRTIDIAFTRARLAVFVDGCFWHGCPKHGMSPATNSDWWTWKLARNKARDEDTTRLLTNEGWSVLRFWEHDSVAEAADSVETAWQQAVLGSAERHLSARRR